MKRAIRRILILTLVGGITGCAAERNSTVSQRLGPYPPNTILYALTHNAAEHARWKQKYKSLSQEQQILYCIDQLQNEQCYGPWSFGVPSDEPYTSNPERSPRAELIRIGKNAIPYLIAALDRKDTTAIVPSRHSRSPWLVQDAALDVIQKTACREFSDAIHVGGPEKSYLAALSENGQNELRATIQTWWETNKDTDEVTWAETALMSDQKETCWYRRWAARYLYARIGARSYPILIRAYERLPRGSDTDDRWDEVTFQKEKILYILEKEPSAREKRFLLQALEDKPFSIRLVAARCLWARDDKTGLDRILRETEGLLSAWGDDWLRDYSVNLTSFFSLCATPEAKEMIVKCLDARNPYLRKSAIYKVPGLKMEKAVRKLPELFDDPYVLGGSYQSAQGDKWVTIPPRQICDAAAEAFNEAVPESPRFHGETDEEQKRSVEIIGQWWRVNQGSLVWDAKSGTLKFRKEPNKTLQRTRTGRPAELTVR